MAPAELEDGRIACAHAGDEAVDHVHCHRCGGVHPLDDELDGHLTAVCDVATSDLSASRRAVELTV